MRSAATRSIGWSVGIRASGQTLTVAPSTCAKTKHASAPDAIVLSRRPYAMHFVSVRVQRGGGGGGDVSGCLVEGVAHRLRHRRRVVEGPCWFACCLVAGCSESAMVRSYPPGSKL